MSAANIEHVCFMRGPDAEEVFSVPKGTISNKFACNVLDISDSDVPVIVMRRDNADKVIERVKECLNPTNIISLDTITECEKTQDIDEVIVYAREYYPHGDKESNMLLSLNHSGLSQSLLETYTRQGKYSCRELIDGLIKRSETQCLEVRDIEDYIRETIDSNKMIHAGITFPLVLYAEEMYHIKKSNILRVFISKLMNKEYTVGDSSFRILSGIFYRECKCNKKISERLVRCLQFVYDCRHCIWKSMTRCNTWEETIDLTVCISAKSLCEAQATRQDAEEGEGEIN
ncbi:hypothetical protein TetV_276 [Tetraselmis virus 1]|uniref:Uncharacterized protein n=1 Tax=Tetraselmis virus 1 TaxID=2060617 RepID=A0A2P0VN91_9VIRU|nr:hypothetical protein QJ968_gp276 [Tetraselmis virus 1]AUF82368.1 hypothetical protein TetV_276 [Tetraselmis virus 1]